MEESKYYDGTKLLSMKDINGNTPDFYLVTSNRTDGKTTYFNRLVVNKFLQKGEKFCLLYRYGYMLDDIADKFFKDIGALFFNEYICVSEKRSKGLYHNIYLCKKDAPDEKIHCGYGLAINNGTAIKSFSHMFSDVERIIFDEFQAEFNGYCDDEINKFKSIYTSIARGQGKQTRHVKVYMLSNTVSVLNPYFSEMGISERLTSETKFLKGDMFVLQVHFNEHAKQNAESNAINRIFKQDDYNEYQMNGLYTLDNKAFIEKMKGNNVYLCTFVYNGKKYSIGEFENGFLYVSNRVDESNKNVFSCDLGSHQENYVLIQRNMMFLKRWREIFQHGGVRFQNLESKNAFIKAMAFTY